MIQDIATSIGEFDVSDEDYLFMKAFVANAVYDDYDRLVQLCDALAMPTGFCLLEKRFVDVTIRYGVHTATVDRWKKILEIKEQFENQIGCSIYSLLPGIVGGIASRMIERNTTIPTKKSQIFSTAADNQTAVDINVVQGERQFARDNKSLGQFRLDGIPPAPRGIPQIEATFDIDANGIVNVSAKDLGTGKEQHITITAGSNMSDADIDKAVKEAAEFEAQDKKRKEAIDTRNEADAMVFQTEKALKEVGDKLDAADKSSVEADVQALKDILAKSTPEDTSDAQVAEIKAAKDKLMESAQKLFTKMYEQAGAAAGAAGGPTPEAGPAPEGFQGDDVVDGDYKEV